MDQYRLPVMVMEKLQHSLRGLVEKYDNIPLNVKLSILDEVCLGLRYLHGRNPPIVHRDLTPNNILLSYRLEAKITDLGVAKVMKSSNQKTMTKLPGTPDFMPPEALSTRPVYGPSLDVFSYGGVILNVTTQLWPQPTDRTQLNPDTDIWEVVSEAKRRQQYLDKMTGGAADLKPLVMSCLNDSPKNRPLVAEVSMTIKRMKDVSSQKSSSDGMSPIVWWAEVSNKQQSQVTALEVTNEQLRKEIDVLKTDVTQLRTINYTMKGENKQLTTLLDKMAVNNENQIQQINSQGIEIAAMKDENKHLKTENDALRDEISLLKAENQQQKHDNHYYTVEQAVCSMGEVYTYAIQHHYDSDQMEDEQKIYDTPCEDDSNYGPIYTEPPTAVEKIYETFEGKRFRKLYHQNIRTLEELGSGEFGVVTRGQLSSATGDVEVAVKTLNSNASAKDRLRFLREAAIMCQFDHQNVIKLHGVVTETPAMIVLEYVSRGDLKELLMSLNQGSIHAKLPLLLLKFCMEISAGMTHLSGKQFVHRDLAARNVLVSENCSCKIAGFGMCRDLLDENYYISSGGIVPLRWTALEALHYKKYSVQSDVWSYGCIMYEIWSLGCTPFEKLTNFEILEKIDSGYRLPPPPGCPKAMYRMMIKCWHPDPRSRPQFGQITKLLSGNSGYLLSWSDEDKQIGGEDAMKLGAPLESAYNLYLDLQQMYKPKK